MKYRKLFKGKDKYTNTMKEQYHIGIAGFAIIFVIIFAVQSTAHVEEFASQDYLNKLTKSETPTVKECELVIKLPIYVILHSMPCTVELQFKSE